LWRDAAAHPVSFRDGFATIGNRKALDMRLAVLWGGIVLWLAGAVATLAQEAWVQIEARPTLAEAEERARAYASLFPNVAGFSLDSGWYAIAIGPYSRDAASVQLGLLKGEGLIPNDSYMAEGDHFVRQFWPVGGAAAAPAPVTDPAPLTEPAPGAALPEVTEPEAETVLLAPVPDETPEQARQSEEALSPEARKELQEALQWFGQYKGAIDGAFGAGTRRSMAAWQMSVGLEGTGILTTAQRDKLLDGFRSERDAIGLTPVNEEEAAIEIVLPLSLVEFDRYQPPFAQYREKGNSGYRVLLISQPGDQSTLSGLYDLMQTLEVVPVEGERQLNRNTFLLTGANADVASFTAAELKGGFIKGFTLIWPAADAARAAKVLEAMKASFRPFGDHALDDSLGEPMAVSRDDLVAGLAVRKPIISRSGFYVDGSGRVATTREVLKNCGRITIDGGIEMAVAAEDAAGGVAILAPAAALAPIGVAELRQTTAASGGEIAVAGYSYPDTLTEPVLTFGTLADTKDLDGNATRERLQLRVLEGDAGGPVIDATGRVIGMLLPRIADEGRVLPDDVNFAADAGVILRALGGADAIGTPEAGATSGAMAAEDIARIGRDMTVQVSCWE
jgi:peptidoglycan hydrolase-like protein with peptidoglycan-binding domain